MTTNIEIRLSRPFDAQRRILDSSARFRVAACGRRFGKTEAGKELIIRRALVGKLCWWLAPTYQMSSEVWRALKRILRPIRQCVIRESERLLELPGGGFIAARSTHDYNNLRGSGLDFVVLDEAAFMPMEVWPEIVRPMLLDRNGEAAFLSTPYGRNWFWDIWKLGIDPLESEWESFHFTSADNPRIDQTQLDTIKRTTPERTFREEYMAEFLEDSGTVFRNVREAATAPKDAAYVKHHRYVMGLDWGRETDFTVAIVLNSTTKQMVAIERFNQIGWELQRGRIETLAEKWKPDVIWAEANSIGSPNIEALQSDGLPVYPFTTTAQSKKEIIEALALAIERKDIALLPDDVLIHELAAYELERLPGGGYRYSAPAGQHDDTVIASALSWHGVVAGIHWEPEFA